MDVLSTRFLADDQVNTLFSSGITYDRVARQENLKQNRNTQKSCQFFLDSCYKMLGEMLDMEVIIRAQHDQILNLCRRVAFFTHLV